MTAEITRRGVEIAIAFLHERLGVRGANALIRKHVLEYKPPQVVMPLQLGVYQRMTRGQIRLPRGMLEAYQSMGILAGATSRIAAPARAARTSATIPLSGNQTAVLEWIMRERFTPERAAAGTAWVNLKMKAGEGKSILGYAVERALGLTDLRTLIVVPTEYLRQQWQEEADVFYDEGAPIIGSYAGGTRGKRDGQIVVGIINSLLRAPDEYFDQFGLVIYDESHDYCSRTFSDIFWRCAAPYQMSMTATPDERKDGFDRALTLHFGHVVDAAALPGYSRDETTFTGEVEIIEYTGESEYTRTILCESTGIISVPLMLQNILRDPHRDALIARRIHSLYEQNRHVMVFSETRNYADTLRDRLVQLGCTVEDEEAETVHVLKGGTSRDEIAQAKADQSRSVILNTFAYSRRGVSIKRMDTLVLATPRMSGMTQVLGRIFRKGSDASIPRIIVDIVDAGTVLRHQMRERIKAYVAMGLRIKKTKVAWNEIA